VFEVLKFGVHALKVEIQNETRFVLWSTKKEKVKKSAGGVGFYFDIWIRSFSPGNVGLETPGGATLKNSPVCTGDWAANLGNRGGTMGQA